MVDIGGGAIATEEGHPGEGDREERITETGAIDIDDPRAYLHR